MISRVARPRVVEYKINYVQRRREVYVYLGSTWVGRIIKRIDDPMRSDPHFAVYLQLPGMWGPVAREDTEFAAKIAATSALNRWLSSFTGEPVEVDERPEKEPVTRIARSRVRPSPRTELEVAEAPRIRRRRWLEE